jgi:hypothetical protein
VKELSVPLRDSSLARVFQETVAPVSQNFTAEDSGLGGAADSLEQARAMGSSEQWKSRRIMGASRYGNGDGRLY